MNLTYMENGLGCNDSGFRRCTVSWLIVWNIRMPLNDIPNIPDPTWFLLILKSVQFLFKAIILFKFVFGRFLL